MASSGHKIKEVIFRAIEKFCYPDLCVQCHKSISGGYVSTTKGFELLFCTKECGHAYWAEYGRHVGQNTAAYPPGPRTCRYPDCNKPCFIQGEVIHNYCGRTHAREHGALLSGGGRGWEGNYGGQTTGYRKQNSGVSHSSSSGWFSQTGPINFYNRGEPYYEFTNFYETMVEIDGKDWLTTEHYFQAQKFVGTRLVETILMLERPRQAFDLSRDPRYSRWRRSDWEEVKEDIMYKALQAKFTQHRELGRMLLETKDRELVEHSPYDSYWGDNGDGSGKNRLGVLLMRLREEMKPREPVRAPTPPAPIHPQQHNDNSPKHLPPNNLCEKDGLSPQPSAVQPKIHATPVSHSPDHPAPQPIVQTPTTTPVSPSNVQSPTINSVPAKVTITYASVVSGSRATTTPHASQLVVDTNAPVITPAKDNNVPVTQSAITPVSSTAPQQAMALSDTGTGLESTANRDILMGSYTLGQQTDANNEYGRRALHENQSPDEQPPPKDTSNTEEPMETN